jgi:energy-coupling factor transporter transmembrane protein EcfT
MDIYFIDHTASQGKGFLHSMDIRLKLLVYVLLLGCVVIVKTSFLVLFGPYLLLCAAIYFAGLPLKKLLLLSLYPLFFGLIFAINIPAHLISILFLKILFSSLLTITLITTTPYVALFRYCAMVLPDVVVQIMFITYRSIFIFLDTVKHLFESMHLRGGLGKRSFVERLRMFGRIVGYLFVRSVDMSEHISDNAYVRGFHI